MIRIFFSLLLINIWNCYKINAQKVVCTTNLTDYQEWVDKYKNEDNNYPSFGVQPLPYEKIHVDTVIIKHFTFIGDYVVKLYKEYGINCSELLMQSAIWINKNGKIDKFVFWIKNLPENHYDKIFQTMKNLLNGYVLKQKPKRNYYLCFSVSLPRLLNSEKK